MRQITIHTNQGDKQVDAYLHGKFAVHLVNEDTILEPHESLWSITHIATGLQVQRMWGRAPTRNKARILDSAIESDITAEDYANNTEAWQAFRRVLTAFVKRD